MNYLNESDRSIKNLEQIIVCVEAALNLLYVVKDAYSEHKNLGLIQRQLILLNDSFSFASSILEEMIEEDD